MEPEIRCEMAFGNQKSFTQQLRFLYRNQEQKEYHRPKNQNRDEGGFFGYHKISMDGSFNFQSNIYDVCLEVKKT